MIAADQWTPADGLVLEPSALDAVRRVDTNLVVTAGPGAGKTELLAQRADYLLRTGQCRFPRRILAISFKVDAAKNLKDRVRRRCGPELAARLDSYTFHAFSKRLIDRFRPVLTGPDELDADYTVGEQRVFRTQIDFGSMVPLSTTILETSEVARAALLQTYAFVFLDEFQDCTANQYRLIRTAFHGTGVRLIAVGDVKQRIMRFAGALDGVMATYAADFDAHPVILYLNFRSDVRLRRMQNAMVALLDPPAAVPADQLVGDAGTIDVLSFTDAADEAVELADRIEQWRDEGTRPDEVAVLVARQPALYTQALVAALRQRSISFRLEGELQDLAAEPVAQLITDFLSVVIEEQEPDAYSRLVDRLVGWHSDGSGDDGPYLKLQRLLSAARSELEGSSDSSVGRRLVDMLVNDVGTPTLAALSAEYQVGNRLRDVIEQVHAQLESLIAETGELRQALHEFTGRDAVKIMTIHKSKGLEFDRVIVLAVENEAFWADIDDERALFFVAISRARHHLCLTYCETRPRPSDAPWRWEVERTPQAEFLGYAASANSDLSP